MTEMFVGFSIAIVIAIAAGLIAYVVARLMIV